MVVETRQLAVGRGAKAILTGVDLAVAPGERVALVGANGSGKTTLLRALAGLDPPKAGEILWAGGPLPPGAARVEQVGVLFQGEAPAPFAVRDLIALGLGLDGPPATAHRPRIDRALARMELATLAGRDCTTLSGGEWQRTAVGRALVGEPRLLLLDEPTNHLDPARRAALLGLLDGLRDQVALVLATHDLDCAAACDRVALFGGGRLIALGSPTEVLTPARLAETLGIRLRRFDDPDGGRPFLRIEGLA